MAKVDVLLFAIASELAGRDSIAIDINLPAKASELMIAIGLACPPLNPWLASCRLAVDQSFVSPDHLIANVVEVALIPPVSGG